MVSYLHREEKASDVNVATHLLVDVMDRRVDAVMIVSNDSDLDLPIRVALSASPGRSRQSGYRSLAGDLRGQSDEGAGSHWWYQITAQDFQSCQLPEHVGPYRRPHRW